MTSMVSKLNMGCEAVNQRPRKNLEPLNLAAIFQARGVTFGPSMPRPTDITGNEK